MLLYANQSGFCLNIVGHDNPRESQADGDRNRLLINLQLTDNGRRWDSFGPLFHADELHKLLIWLKDLLAGRTIPRQLLFQEPFVRIQLSDGALPGEAFQFQFMLCYGAAPPWWTGEPDVPYPLGVECSRGILEGAVADLARQVRAFPTR